MLSTKYNLVSLPKDNLLNVVLFGLMVLFLVAAIQLQSFWVVAAAIIIGIVFVLALAPQNGLYLMAFLFPYINLQFMVTNSTYLPYIDLAAIFVFAAWVCHRFYMWANYGEPFIREHDMPGATLFGLFLFASILSLYNAPDLVQGIKYVLRPLAFFYLMFVVLPYNVIRDKHVLTRIFQIFAANGWLISLMGLASIFLVNRHGPWRLLPVPLLGVYPLGTNQNLIAEALVVIIPFVGILAGWAKNIYARKFYVMSLIVMGVVTLGTMSRAGWLAIFLELSIFTFFYFRTRLFKLLPIVALSLVVMLPLSYYLTQLVSSSVSRQATENRLMLTDIAVSAFMHHPWIGNGAGRYMDLVGIDRSYVKMFGNPLDSHGIIQKLMAETGILGLAAFALFIAYIFERLMAAYHGQPLSSENRKVLVACLAVVAAGLFFQMFNTSYYIAKLWLPVGLALTSVRLIEADKL